tara:strand:- start:4466 stop:5023 length:558 start_codon:yes stop_codon:yes gene_type:complete
MILLQKQKLVIVTPPHTGSGALHKTLCTPEIGGIWVNGINPDGGIDHHYGAIHDGWLQDGFEVITVIREPYARQYGIYKHYIWWLELQDLTVDIPYEKYLNNVPIDWMHQETQYQFCLRNSLINSKIVTTAEIDDVLAFDYDIEIRPGYDYTALHSRRLPAIDHDYFKTEKWLAEVNFWKHSGSI